MDGSTARTRSAGDMAAICSQLAGSFIDLPVQRIEQVVQPTAQQRSTFDDLKKATQNDADRLRSSYSSAVPLSPVARVDTVATRLRAMADAIKSIRPALENFYASLNDEQKARFNMMGPHLNEADASLATPPKGRERTTPHAHLWQLVTNVQQSE
jgi:hypothetical protein